MVRRALLLVVAACGGAAPSPPPAPANHVDADFVRESVLHPTAFAAAGFPPSMPSFEGQLKPVELGALITYIESLQ